MLERAGVDENRRVLIDAFQIPQFLLVPEESPDLARMFDWVRPPGVRSVSCGLFRCIPKVGESDARSIDGKPLRTVINAERCLAAVATFPFGEGPLVLQEMRRMERSGDGWNAFPQPTVVTSLTLACLAFDATGPTHGTVLLQLTTEQAAAILDDELGDCRGTDDEAISCALDVPGRRGEFGLCFASACRWRCREDADCLAGVEAERPGVLCDRVSRVCVDTSATDMSADPEDALVTDGWATQCVRPWGSDVAGVCVSSPQRVEERSDD